MKKVINKTITKKEISDTIAQKLDIKQTLSKKLLQTFIDTLCKELTRGNKIELRDFGIFKLSGKRPRKGRNPKTGDSVKVPEKWVVKFKPGKLMKEEVQNLDLNS